MKFFATEVIRQIDRLTIENEPITAVDLMERAALVLFREIIERVEKRQPVFVFAGQGNNGGDALAVARLLLREGYKVTSYLFNPASAEKKLTEECEVNRKRLLNEFPGTLHEITSEFVKPVLTPDCVVLDGLFGSGLSRTLSGGFAAVVQFINRSEGYVISIDIPSGMMGEETGAPDEAVVVKADLTLTLQFPKLAFFMRENAGYLGEWKVLDISLLPAAIEHTHSNLYYTEEDEIKQMVKCRTKFAHKGDFGHALLVAGSEGMVGAAVLAARAALRSGVGLLTVHGPASAFVVMQSSVPEAMFRSDKTIEYISEVSDTERYRAIGVGPGIGLRLETAAMLRRLVVRCKCPMVLDADALNIMAGQMDLFNDLPAGSIITPHPGEFDRLFGESLYSYERIAKAQQAAKQHNVIIVLKGAHTLVATPDCNLFFNCTGNPGMATAGSGDVLTGIITSLLAQGYNSVDAARLGVFLHGRAGDLALRAQSLQSLIAGDIVAALGDAYKSL